METSAFAGSDENDVVTCVGDGAAEAEEEGREWAGGSCGVRTMGTEGVLVPATGGRCWSSILSGGERRREEGAELLERSEAISAAEGVWYPSGGQRFDELRRARCTLRSQRRGKQFAMKMNKNEY